jgi:hypothetical protein
MYSAALSLRVCPMPVSNEAEILCGDSLLYYKEAAYHLCADRVLLVKQPGITPEHSLWTSPRIERPSAQDPTG